MGEKTTLRRLIGLMPQAIAGLEYGGKEQAPDFVRVKNYSMARLEDKRAGTQISLALAIGMGLSFGLSAKAYAQLLPATVVYGGVTYNLSLTNKISMTASNLAGFEANPWWGNESLALAIDSLYSPCGCEVAAYSQTEGVAYGGATTTFDLTTSGPQYWVQDNNYINSPPLAPQNITGSSGNDLSAVGTTLTTEFDGGTLTSTTDATSTDSFTITGNGGAIDPAGHTLIFTGVFSNASPGTPGYLIIADNGLGGVVVLDPTTGANTFSGGVRVKSGATLQISSGGALGTGALELLGSTSVPAILQVEHTTTITNPIFVSGDPVFDIAAGTTTTVNSAIADVAGQPAGDLVKQGNGALVLTAANTYTGPTIIEAGTLALSGAGSIVPSSAVTNDAVFDISTATTPVRLMGNYSQSGTGTLVVRLIPSAVAGSGTSLLKLNGTANLAGSLAVQVGSGTYLVGNKYDIVSASGGVDGKFAAATYSASVGAYLVPEITYTSNDVLLEVTVPSNSPALTTGRIYAANAFVTNQALFNVMDGLLDGRTTNGSPQQGAWMRGLGSFGFANGYDFNTGGFVVGNGQRVNRHLTLGAAISSIWTGTNGTGSNVSGTAYGLYGYGIYTAGRFEASATVGAGHLGTHTSRLLSGVGTGDSASNGYFTDMGMLAQYRFGGPRAFVIPYASGEYLHTGLGHATETGTGIYDLTYGAMNTDLGQFAGGVKVGTTLSTRFGALVPWIEVGGLGTVGNTYATVNETLGLVAAAESANAAPRGAITSGAGINLIGQGPWGVSVDWGGTYGSGTAAENLGIKGYYTF